MMHPLVLSPASDRKSDELRLERKRLLALTLAAFCIGTSEFIIVGMLPILARDLSVSIPRAGMLVTGYALSVTFGSPLVVLLLGRLDRKRSLLVLLMLFAAGNLLCAISHSFSMLLAARVFTALCHGAFFGIGSVVAANLGPSEERAQDVALMFTGLALANILGVPAGMAVGLHFGWRISFWSLVPLALLTVFLVARLIPSQPSRPKPLQSELHAVLRLPVLLTLLLSTLSSVSLFTVLTYIAPMLENSTHLSAVAVTWALVCFGVGITAGNLIGSRFHDRRQMLLLLGGLTVLALVLFAMPFALPFPVPAVAAVALWGLVHFAAGTPLQPRVVAKAWGANLAATLNQSAFNLGNALGASLGGFLLLRGMAYRMLPTVAGAVATITLAVACIAAWLDWQERRRSVHRKALVVNA